MEKKDQETQKETNRLVKTNNNSSKPNQENEPRKSNKRKAERQEVEEAETSLELKGGVPQGPFLPIIQPLLTINRKGTHQ